MLTIVYQTARRNPRLHWFFDSLARQCDPNEIHLVVVDFYRHAREIPEHNFPNFQWVAPKPNVWQGNHRLTQQNWFAACNSRNTGLCYSPDAFIAYCDDLSVLMPTWFAAVRRAQRENYIALGAYKKPRDLVVEKGEVKSFNPGSVDNRYGNGVPEQSSAGGASMYGCSVAMPVQALLDVNGWPEDLCDGLSFEDVITGIVIGRTNKYSFRYDRTMLTYESEEAHSEDEAMRREDWHFENGQAKLGGNGHNDKSHAVLSAANSLTRFDNYFGEGFADIGALRQHVLRGGEFPIRKKPDHDWYSKVPLRDL